MLQRISRLFEYIRISIASARNGGLPLYRQLVEMSVLFLARGIGPGYYHLAGFSRPDISWKMKFAHLGGRAYTRRLQQLNEPAYRKLSQHKLPEKSVLLALGIPTPRLLAYLHRDHGRTTKGMAIANHQDFENFLTQEEIVKFCLKQVEGHGGLGFLVVDSDATNTTQYLSVNGAPAISTQCFWDTYIVPSLSNGLVMEEYFTQHPAYGLLNPTSVNTLRIWIIAKSTGVFGLLGYIRFGRTGSHVDNQSAGGLVAPVDLATGELSHAICGTFRRQTYDSHPDHGAIINGHTLPFVREAVDLAIEVVRVFPGIKFAGVDVAVGVDGPTIIELNPAPDRQGAAFVDKPSRWLLR